MSLLKPTNNLMSNIMVHGTARITPEVGMGATLAHYTDRDGATVIEVTETKFKGQMVLTIKVQEDDAKRIDNNGFSEAQDYEYTANPNNVIYTYRFVNNKWEGVRFKPETKRYVKTDNPGLILGRRDKYYDFSF